MNRPWRVANSAPVRTPFGYHIIRYEGRKPAGFLGFDQVKPELMANLRKKALYEARAETTRQIFADPTLKVNPNLIVQINAEARAKITEALPAKP